MQVQSLGQADPLEKKWQPTPVFLPGESHGQRSLVGYSPWGCRESSTTKWLSTQTSHEDRPLRTHIVPLCKLEKACPHSRHTHSWGCTGWWVGSGPTQLPAEYLHSAQLQNCTRQLCLRDRSPPTCSHRERLLSSLSSRGSALPFECPSFEELTPLIHLSCLHLLCLCFGSSFFFLHTILSEGLWAVVKSRLVFLAPTWVCFLVLGWLCAFPIQC